ncbi:chemotaxis protein CheW [Desulfovibrio sp. JC010]|uniref:chemotaxis protein CheW n=1 Tax=Desulfovibrio sp. JC010 TaxID=2593641 RepID=UPI0013D5312A|nr:chemotaxis protein CheW [Desulfovibrio sp. JC010]NDV28712.1 chemotaxis protein CheW [Desulfovibrio sp. JC010]
MNHTLTEKHSKQLLQVMPTTSNCMSRLTRLDRQWTMATMTGKINCSRIAQTLIDFIIKTQENFSGLRQNLIEILIKENTHKVVQEISAVAQVVIDILKRNLFERTADVGFLATDDDLVRFLDNPERTLHDVSIIEDRLREYRDKYTVYNEIVILDTAGQVCAHLDQNNHITSSRDPLITETLAAADYIETYRTSDLAPEEGEVLIYSQAIKSPDTGANLGVLCLIFDFAGEMDGIFKHLSEFSKDTILIVLDDRGQAIASSDTDTVPTGKKIIMNLEEDFQIINIKETPYLSKTVKTKGYQGFFGLPWYGHVLKKLDTAFSEDSDNSFDAAAIREKAHFSARLTHVEEASENVLSDLELVVQNGEIMAAKKCIEPNPVEQMEGRALPHILNEIKKIGDQVQHVFQHSTDELLQLVTASRLHDTQFLAQLAIDIMDRNLYERANDCRWWALTSDFKTILAKPEKNEADRDQMRKILGYINSLYTVYTNLFIYDRSGKILACSNPGEYDKEGRILNAGYVGEALRITDSQLYCVSDFFKTDLYATEGRDRYTYIYNASITSHEDSSHVLGGIGIVFDSEPEFEAMLGDVLPQDGQGRIIEGAEGMFVEPGGKLISSTNPERDTGEIITLDPDFTQLSEGESAVKLIEEDGSLYAVGCAHSAGYREYKRDGSYKNDVLCMVRVLI